MPSRSPLTPETTSLVREFLALNRRRLRGNPCLSPHEKKRWIELRGQIEEGLSGSAPPNGARRRALRVPSQFTAECWDSASKELGCAEEIAEGGVFLATERPFPIGTPLRLRLTGDRGETVEVRGAVVWVRSLESGGAPAGMGIEFSNLDQSQWEAVAYLVEQALAAL